MNIKNMDNEQPLPQSRDYREGWIGVSKFWMADEVNETPCSNCKGEVIPYSISNDIWNWVVRKDGSEHGNEYLCIDCFFSELREVLSRMQGWVSVDTPPEIDEPIVLLSIIGQTFTGNRMDSETYAVVTRAELQDSGNLRQFVTHLNQVYFTHWMPLPQPPKDEK